MNVLKVNRLKAIANNVFNVNVDSKNREVEVIEARATCYSILRKDCHLSYMEIGRYFFKNHATIMHHVKQFPHWVKYNKHLSNNYEQCRKAFKNNEMLFDDGLDIVDMMLIKKNVDKLENLNKNLSLAVSQLQKDLTEIKEQFVNVKNC
jgi:hypothetical protein